MPDPFCDLSIIIPTGGNPESLAEVLPQIRTTLERLALAHEILVVDTRSTQQTRAVIQQNQCILLNPNTKGYGDAIRSGVRRSTGGHIIVMDADQAESAAIVRDLWEARKNADVIISSRYVAGGLAEMPRLRIFFSKLLNLIFIRGLDLQVQDMTSGFRIYKSHVLKNMTTLSNGYDILQEILVHCLLEGRTIREIPIHYRSGDAAYERMTQFGLAYLNTYARLWKLRNSIASADYDARAYDAMMPPQRYWQRRRYKQITTLLKEKGKCLDVGCGSSRIIGALPEGSLALDILMRKLRFDRRFGRALVQGSIFDLPIPSASYACVLCSQVIEHVPRANVLDELDRVLQPGGFLILGTPDYDNWQWLVIEWLYKVLLPQAYADEHITHYTFRELYGELVTRRGYHLESTHYILRGELILGLRKPSTA